MYKLNITVSISKIKKPYIMKIFYTYKLLYAVYSLRYFRQKKSL